MPLRLGAGAFAGLASVLLLVFVDWVLAVLTLAVAVALLVPLGGRRGDRGDGDFSGHDFGSAGDGGGF